MEGKEREDGQENFREYEGKKGMKKGRENKRGEKKGGEKGK